LHMIERPEKRRSFNRHTHNGNTPVLDPLWAVNNGPKAVGVQDFLWKGSGSVRISAFDP
jgi:hypothetical protein